MMGIIDTDTYNESINLKSILAKYLSLFDANSDATYVGKHLKFDLNLCLHSYFFTI